MRKQLFYLLLIVSTLFVQSLRAQTPRVEIHQLGVGDGDACLIIVIDTTITGYLDTAVVLIDANRTKDAGTAIWKYMRDTLNALSPTRKKVDFVIVSHMHIDHLGGMTTVLDSMFKNKWSVDYIIDREGSIDIKPDITWSLDSTFKYECVDEKISFAKYSATSKKYVTAAARFKARISIWPNLDIFTEKNFKNASMICLAALGAASANNLVGYTMFLRERGSKYVPYNENDLSFVFNIGLGMFNYFTGGDIGGGSPYADGETPIANYLGIRFKTNFHYCGFKVSHHGSAHSTNNNFMMHTKPTMAVVPACLRTYSGTALPTKETVRELDIWVNPPSNVLFCFQPVNSTVRANYWTKDKLAYLQDVVVKVRGLPLAGQPIPIQVTTRLRNKSTLAFAQAARSVLINCTQNHVCSFK